MGCNGKLCFAYNTCGRIFLYPALAPKVSDFAILHFLF